MFYKTKTIELTTNDLDTLTVLLRRKLAETIEWVRTAPLDQDTDDAESEADHLFALTKRLEAVSDELSREIFAEHEDPVPGMQQVFK